MTLSLTSLWRWSAFGFYAIVVFGICVYLTFPSSQFHAWLVAESDRRFGVTLATQSLQSHTPLHFEIDEGTLSFRFAHPSSPSGEDSESRVLPIERVIMELHAWPLLLGQYTLSTEIGVFGGMLRGTFAARDDDMQWRYHVSGDGESLDLHRLEEYLFVSSELRPVFTAGTGAVQFDLTWHGTSIRSGVGDISFSVHDAILALDTAPPLTVATLSGSLAYDRRGWWRSDDLRMVGANDEFAASGRGRFLFEDTLSGSIINLSVSVTMNDIAKRRYPQLAVFIPDSEKPAMLTVTGTLSRPVVLVNGVPVVAR